MRLWKVTIDGIGHRHIPAKSQQAAIAIMQELLTRAMPISAEAADVRVAAMWSKATQGSERSQRLLLQRLDGLTGSPLDRRSVGRARLQAEENLKHVEAMEAYIDQVLIEAGPLSPQVIEKIRRVVTSNLKNEFSEWQ